MLLSGSLVYGCARCLYRLGAELLRLPDEVLQEVALVLGEEEVLGEPDNFSGVGNKGLAFC